MSRLSLLVAALILWAAAALTACGSSCDDLADVACEAAGAESEECVQVRDKASKASSDDQRACEVALALVESLEKAR